MHTITINVKNKDVFQKINNFINTLKDEVEIVSQEDIEDLKLLAETRNEESIPFEKFIKNENIY